MGNVAGNYDLNPLQETMKHARFNPNIYPYYYPFIMEDEEFRRISDFLPEYKDYFWVSNYGRVYNANNGYFVIPHVIEAGYTVVSIRKTDAAGGGSNNIGAHILVCTCFNGPKPGPGYQVNHKDFKRSHNYYKNLEWTTPQENLDYSRAAGNYWNGNVYSSAKYTEAQIRYICELLQSGITDPPTICMKVFGCEPNPGLYSLIRQIKSGKNWIQISKDYSGILDVEHRNFTPDWIIHGMCNYMKNNPATAYSASINEVLLSFGVNPETITTEEYYRYKSALQQLRYKNAYRRIADQYDISRQ